MVSGRSIDTSSGFPFCRFYLAGMTDTLEDQQSYYRTYRFAIDVIQELTAKDRTTAEANFQDAIEAVLNKLNTDWQLNNAADDSDIDAGTVSEVELPQGPAAIMQITLSVRTLIYS